MQHTLRCACEKTIISRIMQHEGAASFVSAFQQRKQRLSGSGSLRTNWCKWYKVFLSSTKDVGRCCVKPWQIRGQRACGNSTKPQEIGTRSTSKFDQEVADRSLHCQRLRQHSSSASQATTSVWSQAVAGMDDICLSCQTYATTVTLQCEALCHNLRFTVVSWKVKSRLTTNCCSHVGDALSLSPFFFFCDGHRWC